MSQTAPPPPLPDPTEAASLQRRVERYLEAGRHISLHAEMLTRAEALVGAISEPESFPAVAALPPEDAAERAERYEALSEPLLAAVVTGCYWGDAARAVTWAECVTHVASAPRIVSEHFYQEGAELLRLYPGLLLTYGAGVAAVAARRYDTLAALLNEAIPAPWLGQGQLGQHALASAMTVAFPLTDAPARALLTRAGLQGVGGPLDTVGAPSRYLSQRLRPFFARILLRDVHFDRSFAEFEFWLDLAGVDERARLDFFRNWYRTDAMYHASFAGGRSLVQKLDADSEREEGAWPPLHAGLLGGTLERYRAAREIVRRL